MRFGSLFAGIGGLDLGLERSGMECCWQVEIDDYANRVLEKHWPNVRRWRDVHDFIADAEHMCQRRGAERRQKGNGRFAVHGEDWHVNLICGGFPCQPVSLAGNRRGDADERWLWDAFRKVVSIIRPQYVLVENVPGLRSAKDAMGRRGGLMRGILGDLAEMGYDAEWGSIPAAAFDLPHLRERVFIVASSRTTTAYTNQPRPQERKGEPSNSRPQREATERTDWRTVKPTICRGGARIPNRVDRLKGLGNAVVPQVAEFIGRRIMEHAQ